MTDAIRVLYVDDEPALLESAKSFLRMRGDSLSIRLIPPLMHSRG